MIEGHCDSSSLKDIFNFPKLAIKERHWKNVFVPLLLKDSPEEFNRRWLDEVVMGRVNVPVNVIDENKNVLFELPPLRGKILTSNHPQLAQLLKQSSDKGNVIPKLGLRMLEEIIDKTMVLTSEMPEEYAIRWHNAVAAYSGGEIIPITTTDKSALNSSTGVSEYIEEDEVEW